MWRLLRKLLGGAPRPDDLAPAQRAINAPWWRKFPRPERRVPRPEDPDDKPRLRVGDLVRLKGKPQRCRRVIKVEWHRCRYEYVYVVETSAPPNFRFGPYWFYDQLDVTESGERPRPNSSEILPVPGTT